MHSTKYTLIYTCILTIVVAVVLSLAATTLKPFQDKNIELERKKNILKAIGDKLHFDKPAQNRRILCESISLK